MDETIIRAPSATALLVGAEGSVPSELAIKVFSAFTHARMRIVRVGGPELACERMVTTMPQVVVTLGPLLPQQRVDLGDHAAAVGAVMVELDANIDPADLDQQLAAAVEQATDRTKRNSAPRIVTDEDEPEDDDSEDVRVDMSIDTAPPPADHPGAGNEAVTEPPKPVAPTDEIDENW